MKSLKIFTVAMALIFTLSVVSSNACDKHKTSAKNECSTTKVMSVSAKTVDAKTCNSSEKTVSNGECSTAKVVQVNAKADSKSCCTTDKTVSKGECSTAKVVQVNAKADSKACCDSKLEAKNDVDVINIKPVSEVK